MIPLEARTIILLNGAFEIIASTLLLLGFYTRITAILLGLHLLTITFSIGFTQTGVRDFGLSIATLAIAINGPDKLCLENYLQRKNTTNHTGSKNQKDQQ